MKQTHFKEANEKIPFQAFECRKLKLVFENGKFHDLKFATNNYKCDTSVKVNLDCANLKYNTELIRLIDQTEHQNKFLNHQYMNYSGLVDKIRLYTSRLGEYRLLSLKKDFEKRKNIKKT